MTPRRERLAGALLWGSVAILMLVAVAFGIFSFVIPRQPRPLPSPAKEAAAGGSAVSAQELEAFTRKRMSRAIIKAAPPPPPKPVVAPLDTVVRLSGIIDYGPDSPREAFIELRLTSQTKSYRVGDALPSIGAVVKGISDAVLVEYDGTLWKLTDRGVTPAPITPVSTSGTKP